MQTKKLNPWKAPGPEPGWGVRKIKDFFGGLFFSAVMLFLVFAAFSLVYEALLYFISYFVEIEREIIK